MDIVEGLRYQNLSKAAWYTVTFNQHVSCTGWNDQMLTCQYYKGLPNQLKDDIACIGKLAKLCVLQNLITTLDQCDWECQSRDPESPSTLLQTSADAPKPSESSAKKIFPKFFRSALGQSNHSQQSYTSWYHCSEVPYSYQSSFHLVCSAHCRPSWPQQ